MGKFIPVCEPYLNGNELKYVTDAVSTGWISSSGTYVTEFEKKFGYALPSYIIDKAKEYEKYGYMNVTDKSISFTPKGFLVSNSIISEMI